MREFMLLIYYILFLSNLRVRTQAEIVCFGPTLSFFSLYSERLSQRIIIIIYYNG